MGFPFSKTGGLSLERIEHIVMGLGRSLWAAVSLGRKKDTVGAHKKSKDNVLWQPLEHNVAIVATLAPQIDADKEQERGSTAHWGSLPHSAFSLSVAPIYLSVLLQML